MVEVDANMYGHAPTDFLFDFNGIDAVLDYFEDNYIGRQRRGRPKCGWIIALQRRRLKVNHKKDFCDKEI